MMKDLQNISYQLDNLLHETSFIKSDTRMGSTFHST